MSINYSFELHELSEAITPYGVIETKTPQLEELLINDFTEGNHFRTGAEEETKSLIIKLENRGLTFVLDKSGSMTWNDVNGDRYTYLKRLIQKLLSTYPGSIKANLVSFGGTPSITNMFVTQGGANSLSNQSLDFSSFLQQTFEDSVFDFSGTRVVRRDDGYPEHPADGVVVSDGIFEAVKDENLSENTTYYYGIWTFNKDQHFSQGQFLKGTPKDRILPAGVNYASATQRVLPGVRRDEFTQLIYNFQEGQGYVIYDSSGNGLHGTLNSQSIIENFWTGDAASSSHSGGVIKKSSGVKFDGEFDIIETNNSPKTSLVGSNNSHSNSLTINFWIFRYQQSSDTWIIGSSASEPSNDVGWAIGITPNGKVGIKLDGDISSGFEEISGSPFIAERSWSMITCLLNTSGCCDLYVDGVLFVSSFCPTTASSNIDTSGSEKIYIGAKPDDSSSTWSGVDYFGSLAQISISSTERDVDWITQTYRQEQLIFNQDANTFSLNPPDNKQREVILTWQIGSDFNYENGRVRIIRKYREIPSHDEDGTEVLNQPSLPGDFFFIDSYSFIHNNEYYYRIFTYNSLNNPCDRQDARVLPVKIQNSTNSNPSPALERITGEDLISGNKKLLLQWNAVTDERVRGTRIYFSDQKFPVISLSSQGDLNVTDGIEIKDTASFSFIHRISGRNCEGADIPLVNGKTHYYTVVNYDELNSLSEPVFFSGIPSAESDVAFPPELVSDLHLTIVNSGTLSLKWKNPTIKTSKLDLYLGETALVYINIRDTFGGELQDLNNIELKVCTTIKERFLKTDEIELSNNNGINEFSDAFNPRTPCSSTPLRGNEGGRGGSRFGIPFDEDCNDERETAETIVISSTVESGLIKGVISHTNDRAILSRREGYIINARAQLIIKDPENTERVLFRFNTQPVTVTFTHPIKITAINKRNKFFSAGCEIDGEPRVLDDICTCNEELNQNPCEPKFYNGGYVGATRPYVCRIELQYRGESLPDGTPINIQLFKHADGNPLTQRSDRTFIREGRYLTSAILEEETEGGEPTGKFVSKSVCDIEITHPQLPDWVDLYASLDFAGFLVEAVHEVRFVSSLFIRTEITKPTPDGIDVAEQFASVWQVNPDDPFNPDANIPAPDGTLVKWQLIKGRHGKDRPFYSTERLPVLISGIYSITSAGVARNVFLGPIGNLESHIETLTCRDEDGSLVSSESCCIAEEYEIHASVIVREISAKDAAKFAYGCSEDSPLTNKRFLMNAAPNQPGSNPHWITWADGIHMLKFQIAKNPAISDVLGADCFRQCVESQVGGQLFAFPEQQIIHITAPGEILWNVVFDNNPYTNETTLHSYESVLPPEDDEYGTLATASIPITGETTDFYLRINRFINSANPKPKTCDDENGGSGLGGGSEANPCEWRNICNGTSICSPSSGRPWENVEVINGTTTLIANNRSVTLFGGGDYKDGIPPVYAGFKEPLDVRIIEARINGNRVGELVVDSFSIHTFVVEVTFTALPVPDGTRVFLSVEGQDQDIVLLSNSTVFTQQINDPLINPTGDKRSLAFFSIEPLPNITFDAKINVICNYDKLGTIIRSVSRCIEISNTTNQESLPAEQDPNRESVIPSQKSAASNDEIIYNSIDDSYRTTTASLISRIGHFAAVSTPDTSDLIYHFGGFTGNSNADTSSITPISEVFDTNIEKWSFIPDMPTPRCFGMTVVKDENIYCIGGIEVDQLLSQHAVSRKIESFNTAIGIWSTLSPMPENYGVAYGDAQLVDNFIYVTCGINTIIDNSKPGVLNDQILRYSILDDLWEKILPSNINLYKRLSPFGFFRNHEPAFRRYYLYGGSIAKSASQIANERTSIINELLNQFRSFILTSSYYLNLSPDEQVDFIFTRESEIRDKVQVPAFIYLSTGFKFTPGSETLNENNILTMDISNTLDSEWRVLPKPRDMGKCIYLSHQDTVYFLGGSNQNNSTTLNRVESIDLSNGNLYDQRKSLGRGRAMFGAINIGDDIYISGGLTSGHKEGWVEIETQLLPEFVEASGTQSAGMFITLKNDSGEVIEDDIRVDIKGRIRIPEIDDILVEYAANRAADRALGGDGSGNAPDRPESGDPLDIERLQNAQNSILDPNSDQFQFNAARKLNEQVSVFPVLYSRNDFIAQNGLGGSTLLPRSEDPLSDFKKLSALVNELVQNTPPDQDETFTGDLTREEMAALGDVLETVNIDPTIITSGYIRQLYDIETIVTVLDTFYFGQTVSQFDIELQNRINERIQEILTPPLPDEQPPTDEDTEQDQQSKCFVIQHSAQPSISPSDTPPSSPNPNNPSGTGGFAQSGQCLFCESILPLNIDIRGQNSALSNKFFGITDWLPQTTEHKTDIDFSLSGLLREVNNIDREVPFGSSQLYDALVRSSIVSSGDNFSDVKKVIYILSDNSQNLSIASRNQSIDEVNSIDGDKLSPVIYTVFSTSFPLSLSALLERSEAGDVDKITQETGGQSSTLISSGFLDQILNLTLGSATGGLGYGVYTRRIELEELSYVSSVTLNFDLPINTQGFVRIRHSEDGYNFNDFSERLEGSQTYNLNDFFAKTIDFEVVLTTGFTVEISEEYDNVSTGIPKMTSISFEVSGEKEDFIFIDKENVLTNVQQIAMSFDGTIPKSSIVEMGAAASMSHNWSDFQSQTRPALNEFGKMFMLERASNNESVIRAETLKTVDNILYDTEYGPWDSSATVEIYYTNNTGTDVTILSGFKTFPREGQIYFDTRQDPERQYKISIVNDNKLRIGIRLRNRVHSDPIIMEGAGFIYSTNNIRPPALAQVAPKASNVTISPPNPNAGDEIFALYSYRDLNNNKESGTIISWYKNSLQLFEIQNRTTWSNNDLILSHKLVPGDRLQYSVTPSDGLDFGTTIFSPAVIIQAREPSAENIRIIPIRNNVINDRLDTSSIFLLEYVFNVDDLGATEDGTSIRWLVNGIAFKEGFFTDGVEDPYFNPRTIEPNEIISGRSAHLIGNQIQVEITPRTSNISGPTTRSSILTVENSRPIIDSVQISPLNARVNSTLLLAYSISDQDLITGTQTDRSEIKWYRSSDAVFVEVIELKGQKTVPPFYLRVGEQWKATVQGFDGLDLGNIVTSNIVQISA